MDSSNHFRRCHVCGNLNSSSDEKITHCQDCGKSLAPFYYFDVRAMAIYQDGERRPPFAHGEYQPIQGLAAFWDQT